MNERTLNRALDGEEIIEIIVHDLRQQLQRNCTLAKHLSYPAFTHKTICLIQYQTTGKLTETQVQSSGQSGHMDPKEPVKEAGLEVQGQSKPPNAARMDAHLPIPALTTDAAGKQVETKISYRDPQFVKAK